MSAAQVLGGSRSETQAGEEQATAQKRQPGILDRCQPLVALFSTTLPILTFLAGSYMSQRQHEDAQREVNTSEWRAALQRVGFEEASLLPTVFQMEEFDAGSSPYRARARQIERTALEHTEKPETFDLIFSNMLQASNDADDVNELVEVGVDLDSRLHALWMASMDGLAGNEPRTFEYFLQKPSRFYPAESHATQLREVISLLWELDTFSGGMACTWSAAEGSCPKIPGGTGLNLQNVTLVNYDGPPHAPDTPAIPKRLTCSIYHGTEEALLTCK